MTILQDTLGSEILLDLSGVRVDLVEARRNQAERDCAVNRAVVAECHARIDALLDLFLETSATSATSRGPSGPSPARPGAEPAGTALLARPSPGGPHRGPVPRDRPPAAQA
jgi:hypothetical protein